MIVGLPDRACAERGSAYGVGSTPRAALPRGRDRQPRTGGLRKETLAMTYPSLAVAASRPAAARGLDRHASVEIALDGRLRRVGGVRAVAEARVAWGSGAPLPADSAPGVAGGYRGAAVQASPTLSRICAGSRAGRDRGARLAQPTSIPVSPTFVGTSARGGRSRSPRHGHNLLGGPPEPARRCLRAAFRESCRRSTLEASLEVTRITPWRASLARQPLIDAAVPAPHHSASAAAVVGGG